MIHEKNCTCKDTLCIAMRELRKLEAANDALTAERDAAIKDCAFQKSNVAFLDKEVSRLRNKAGVSEEGAGRLREALHLAWGIIEWMSGSPDFGPGGKAHEGWVKAQYDISQIRSLMKEKRA